MQPKKVSKIKKSLKGISDNDDDDQASTAIDKFFFYILFLNPFVSELFFSQKNLN